MNSDLHLKEILVSHLKGGEAYKPLAEILQEVNSNDLATRPQGLPYSFYEIFYHIWFTQQDILKYCKEENYEAPNWPQDYWPQATGPKSEEEWEALKKDFFRQREQMIDLLLSAQVGLTDTVPSNRGHTIFREFLLLVEHTSYHTGQLLILLRHLGVHSS